MKELYLLPSLIASVFLFSIAIYLLLRKPRKRYILPLSLICWAVFLWNVGIVITNLTDGEIVWAKMSTLGLIFIPSIIFHFTIEYTKFFKDKYYLLAYAPAFLLAISLPLGYYVTGVEYRSYGFEPTYEFLLFSVNSWIGIFFVLFSTFILFKYYKENVGIKKHQTLYVLFAIPANAFLSFISYEVMVGILHVAQFPVGAVLDFIMIGLIVYAILRFKLPVETAAEIDFRILAETASDGICIIDETGDIDYSNTYFCDMVNIPNRKILGKAFAHFVTGALREEVNNVIKKTVHGEKILGVEVELKKEGNGTIATEVNTSPIIWNDKIIGGFITIRDIEERKKAEDALKKSEEKYRDLFENASEGLFTVDRLGRFTSGNKRAEEISGYKREELIGKSFQKLVPLKHLPNILKLIQKALKGEIEYGAIEIEIKNKKGQLIPVDITGRPIEENGKVIGIQGVVRDFSERKRMEETLKESEERYRSIVEKSHAGIVIIDNSFCIVYANNQVAKILGYSTSEIVGEDFRKFLDEESKKLAVDRYKRRQGGEDAPDRYEIRVMRKNGEKRDLEVSSAIIKDPMGNVRTIAQVLDITHRKKAEEELRKAEERYRGIFENAIMGIYQSTPEGHHIRVNPELAHIYGYDSPEELINNVTDIAKQLYVDPHRRVELVRQLQEHDDISNFESKIYRKDRSVIWISENARTIRDANGNILYFVGTVEDITERKRAEEAVKESEEKYRSLVGNLNVGIYRNTPGERGNFIEANPAITQMFGYESREDFLKLNVSDLYYHPTDRKRFNKKMLKDGFVRNEEIQLKRKDNSFMWGSVTAIAVKDEQGKVEYYDGIIEDITYRKKAEEEILKQKTYFQALFESSAEAIVSLDEQHCVLEVNPTFVKLFGYSFDELKGKDLDDFVLPEGEDKIGRELTEKVVRGGIVKAEGQRKKKDGSLINVSILGAPIFIEGKQVGIYTIYRDIAARKEAEQEREFYDSLLRHDVANRNTIIQGSLELLEEEDLTEEQESIVKNALKAARSSSELIDMIRSLRRISGERDLTSAKLHDTISKVVDILDQQAKSKGIRIKYTHVKGVVKADQLIENIFSNIIQNAIIHSNCSTIIISGKEEEKGGEVVYKISIEDNGEGIPDDIKGNVFGLGVRNISSSGSGLGLYLVKKIVESYGGSVNITKPKKPKHGTIFSVYLPKFK